MIYPDRETSDLEAKAKKTLGKTFLPQAIDRSILKVLSYQYPQRKIWTELTSDEFSCLCPFSGLPDFARITIKYIPRKKLVELKSLKYYLFAFRQVKIYNEHVVNKILEDLKRVLSPVELVVIAEFTSRGGIKNKAIAAFKSRR